MPAKRTTKSKSGEVWTDEERAAMQESARERKKAAKAGSPGEREQGESDVQAKIAEMPQDDRKMAARIHELVTSAAPDLVPRTYYGMPAYAKDGKVVCFFQAKSKFKVRYSTFGFQPDAKLDEGEIWPTSFAVVELTAPVEKRLTELVRKAAS
ncbi:MAG TPA: hypothetical protein VMZ33_04565 [Candidatus Limnocylindrales bacterium]|nr:hypothetical protein [Candidatus Limnocylindrales bacterium]